jgi:hypothetical protein
MGTNVTSSSQSPRRNVKVSITDFPKFNGDAKEWIPFSRKFLAVASSQGFEYLFQDPEFIPITASDEAQYKSDLAFIFDAFKNSWAGARNYFLVQQAEKPEKNGRKIYFDAQKYFRGEAQEDSIIMENVAALVNTKLTMDSFKGAEGYNDRFNETVNTLEQQGETVSPRLLKCIYLSNIQDKKYDSMEDQSKFSLPDVQATILRKHLQSSDKGRAGAPNHTSQRFVYALQSFLAKANVSQDPFMDEIKNILQSDDVDDQRDIFATCQAFKNPKAIMLPVPLGYTMDKGEQGLISLNPSLSDLGEMGEPTHSVGHHWIDSSHRPLPPDHMHYRHTKMKNADYQRYQPIGWKALEVIKKIFEETTQFAGIYFNLPPPLKQMKACLIKL